MLTLPHKYKVTKIKVKDPDAPRMVNKDFFITGIVQLALNERMFVADENSHNALMTSPVINMEDTDTGFLVETTNSLYTLERIENVEERD